MGFVGELVKTTLPVGTKLDRYGNEKGAFRAPYNTPYGERALAPGSKANGYFVYEVIKPLPVIQGDIAPAFSQICGGIQIWLNMQERVNVKWLLDNEYIKKAD